MSEEAPLPAQNAGTVVLTDEEGQEMVVQRVAMPVD